MLYKEIDTVEFDLNTVCNSYCPPCHRYTVQDGELFHNPYVKLGVNLELDVIERVFENSRITDDCFVDLVGLVGEPIAHPKFMEIVDIIYKHRPNAAINLHTNGGLRTEKMFYDLGKKFNKHSWIKFSLDGLEDTNGIYRIGVDYNKVVANMRAFIDGGGRAIWKFVTFKWNEHQVEQAEALSKEYGCYKFQQDWDVNDQDIDIFMAAAQKKINKKTASRVADFIEVPENRSRKIKDKCFSYKKIYVNAHGYVIPCCMFNGSFTYESMRKQTLNFIKEDRGEYWNSLYHNDLESIMSDTWWQKLKDSFESGPCDICVSACGVKLD
jgi:MoaA/NifB/PqqE/SkfB family radical SAM enzyme